jgi:hypothetical protein
MLMGVFGGSGALSWPLCLFGGRFSFASLAGKGSELRNACFVEFTRDEKFDASFEDFLGGSEVSDTVDS